MASPLQPSPRQLILLIGSDPSLLAGRQRLMQRGACDVILVCSEEQAVAALQNGVFDLLVVSHTVSTRGLERLEELVALYRPETLLLRLPPHMPTSDRRYITDAMPEALLDAVTAILSSRPQLSTEFSDAQVDRRRNREQWLIFVDHLLAQGFVLQMVDDTARLTSRDGRHSVALPTYEGVEETVSPEAKARWPEFRMTTICTMVREKEFYRLIFDGVPGRLLIAAEAEGWLWDMVTPDHYPHHVAELASLGTTEFTFEDAQPAT